MWYRPVMVITPFACAKESRFDLVFMDIQMPGLNGLEATQAIRLHEQESGQNHRTPIVALTAHAMANEREALLKSGMDDYLTKPVQESQLAHMMSKWADRPSSHHHPTDDAAKSVDAPILTDTQATPEKTVTIDWEESVRLAAGKRDLARDMLLMLLNSLEQEKCKIVDACESNHMEALLGHVHYLHGATRYCGVPALRYAAHELETHIKTRLHEQQGSRTANDTDTAHCRADLERLIACIDDLIRWREQNELPA
jgi:two-component system sensor histidine kinase BarA